MIFSPSVRIALIRASRPPHARRVPRFEIVEIQDFGLEIEVQLPPQEPAKVLVDEVVKAVLRGISGDMAV